MILVGELEYTNKMMAPDGSTGFLWVGEIDDLYRYNISPYADNAWVGDNSVSQRNMSVTEFLQLMVNMDDDHGGGLRIKYADDVGIRLKGMTEWITRQPLSIT